MASNESNDTITATNMRYKKQKLKYGNEGNDNDCPLNLSDEDEEDEDGEVRKRGRGKSYAEQPKESDEDKVKKEVENVGRKGGKTSADQVIHKKEKMKKSKKCSKQPEESDEESSTMSSEESEEKEVHIKVRRKREILSAPPTELTVHEKERKKRKIVKEKSKKQPEPQVHERKEQKQREMNNKDRRKLEKRYESLEMPSDSYEYQSDDEITKSKRSKRKKQVKVKPGNANSLYSVKMANKNTSECKEVKMHKGKKNKGEKVLPREYYQKAAAASNKWEKYSNSEVSETPVRKPKKIQPESEYDYESSFTSTGEEETSEIESTPPKYKTSTTHTGQKHQKIQSKNDQMEINIKEGKLSGKKKMPQEKLERDCHYPKKRKHFKGKEGKRATQVRSEKTRASILLDRESVKTQGKATQKHTEKKIEKQGKKAACVECASNSTQQDEESDSDDSSEDEEDRDSEEESSNEEEETEPDDESSTATSEEEEKEKSSPNMPLAVYEREEDAKEGTGKIKNKRMKVGTGAPRISCDDKQTDASGKGSKSEPKSSKKRSRRRHRESSMSPTTRGSSSPSNSPEDHERPDGSRRQKQGNDPRRRKKKKGGINREEKAVPSSSETDDSSPECDMAMILSESENKNSSRYSDVTSGSSAVQSNTQLQ